MYIKASALISKALRLIMWLGGLWIFLRFLLPWTAPLILAFGGAVALEKPVRTLCRRGLPRAAASGICVAAFIALLAALLWLFMSRLLTEARHLGESLPLMAEALSERLAILQAKLLALADRLPPSLTQVLGSAGEGVADYLSRLPGELSAKAVSLLSGFVAELPSWLLFTVTGFMGLYFISAAYPDFTAFAARQIPGRLYIRAAGAKEALSQSLGKYIKAQLIMSAITFVQLLTAFLLLGISSPLVLALITAVIDALPVFGSGTVLLPWALWEFLSGDRGLGLGLAISYAAITVLRSCIQAKLLGDQLGLHPIATLAAIYAGWKAFGLWGMVIFPIAAISLKKLNDSGIIHLYKGEENDRNNFQHNRGNGNEHTGSHEYPSG